jgi:hypothetical protein
MGQSNSEIYIINIKNIKHNVLIVKYIKIFVKYDCQNYNKTRIQELLCENTLAKTK